MKKKFVLLVVLFVTVFFIPFHAFSQEVFRQDGIASWYGREFEGRPTASGEIFDASLLTAAHPSLPFGTMLVVTNTHNNKKVTVRVNDRGPFVSARIIDVSMAAAQQLDMIATGTAPVTIESIDRIVITASAVQQPVVISSPVVQMQPIVVSETVQSQPVVISPAPVQVVYVQQPAHSQIPNQIKLTPQINIAANKTYRLQIGSYRVAKNAVDTFDKLKETGLNPAYERFIGSDNGEYFRVVLAGVSGIDMQLTTEKLGAAGFKEALIREEN